MASHWAADEFLLQQALTSQLHMNVEASKGAWHALRVAWAASIEPHEERHPAGLTSRQIQTILSLRVRRRPKRTWVRRLVNWPSAPGQLTT